MREEIIEKIIRLLEIAKNKEWTPWELQTELRKFEKNVVSVGDDLSFTLKLNGKLAVDEEALTRLGAQKTKIYPFKRAYRFEHGFIAVEDKFIRISRNLKPEELSEILLCID
ncbi:MAG: hypothetical protein H0Z28_01035 [Archaeoglobus sp.]|nr:hypothetical protein [Archaeoglobus sp.]